MDRFLPVSSYIKAWTEERYGLNPERLYVIPNGADTDTFHPRPDFSEPSLPVRMLFLGRLNPEKGRVW